METNVEFNGNVSKDDHRNWMLTVRVTLKNVGDKVSPYIGTVQCVSILRVSPEWPESDIEKLVFINGTGMLYSSIREMICNITSRGPYAMAMLPAQSFLEAYQRGKTAVRSASLAPA